VQTIFYPLEMYTRRREGTALRVAIQGPEYESSNHGMTTVVDSSAILNGDSLHVFATNRNLNESARVEVNLADAQIIAFENGELLTGPAPDSANTFEHPQTISPQAITTVEIMNGQAVFEIPPLSLAALTFRWKK